jgi:hypothetical protein
MRTRYRSLVADRDRRATFFHYDYLFGVVVLVEGNHRTGIHHLGTYVEIFGVSVLLIDLDEEL